MACGGFTFVKFVLSFSFVLVFVNLVLCINLFCWVHVEILQRRSGAVRHGAEHDSVRRHT
jgi:hypothetical protein